VLIRTFLSFSLEIEIEGMVPWRRAFVSGATVVAQSSRAPTKAGTPSAVGREGGSA
jgi:hypothetical protein